MTTKLSKYAKNYSRQGLSRKRFRVDAQNNEEKSRLASSSLETSSSSSVSTMKRSALSERKLAIRNQAEIRAPVDGTVTEVDAAEGNLYDMMSVLMILNGTSSGPLTRPPAKGAAASCKGDALFTSWTLPLLFIIGGLHPGRLADIGPTPRTVLVDSASKPFDLACRGERSCSCRSSIRHVTGPVRHRRHPWSGFRRGSSRRSSGEVGRVRLDHARPQTRYARGLNRYARNFGADLGHGIF